MRHYRLGSVAQQQVGYMQRAIIDSGLVQDFLRQRYRFRLELQQHQRLHLQIIDDSITPLLQFSYLDRHLYGYQRMRIMVSCLQRLQYLLPHPLFGRHPYETSSPCAKHLLPIVDHSRLHRHAKILLFLYMCKNCAKTPQVTAKWRVVHLYKSVIRVWEINRCDRIQGI